MRSLVFFLLSTAWLSYTASDVSAKGSPVSIKGMLDGPNRTIKCYLPIGDFGNTEIAEEVKSDKDSRFSVTLDVEQSSFVRLIFGGSTLWLVVEPGDSILIDWMSPEAPGKFLISGNNSAGHLFYNMFYNVSPGSKFSGLRNLFKTRHTDTVEKISVSIVEEFQSQTQWLDSLLDEGKITASYHQHLKTEIYGSLSWEVGNLANKFYGLGQITKHDQIMSRLFEFNPIGEQLSRCCMGLGYYITYFKQMTKWNKSRMDSASVLIEDESYIALAPFELQKFLWARTILIYLRFVPTDYDYCDIYKRYLSRYNRGPFSRHLEALELCSSDDRPANHRVIEDSPANLQSLIDRIDKKNLYVDIWATWCAPCKAEFQYYTEDFLTLLEKYDTEMVFISIDDTPSEEKWRKEVSALNLPGYHIRANSSLLKDIKQVVYSGQLMDIPRYMLVDSAGKIVDKNARRPSDSLLKGELESLFGK